MTVIGARRVKKTRSFKGDEGIIEGVDDAKDQIDHIKILHKCAMRHALHTFGKST